MGLDRLSEEQSEHRGRNESDDEVRYETPCLRVAREPRQRVREARAVFPHDREHRARLNRNLENLRFLVLKVEELPDHDQVAGARDWKEFGETFDDAEDQRLQQNEAGDFSR